MFIFVLLPDEPLALLVSGAMTQFTPHQQDALKSVSEWLKARPGTNGDAAGASACSAMPAPARPRSRATSPTRVDGEVKFAAFTGKAALVMRGKGCARRLHHPQPDLPRARERRGDVRASICGTTRRPRRPKLIVIDECSMVDAELGRDLMSFGVPVLVLGDPAQLPPIQGGGFFTEAEPDAMLTEVHRQAQDDPIVRLSMEIRAGERLEPGDYGETEVVRATPISIRSACSTPTRCWSGATRRGAPTMRACASGAASPMRCRRPATSWSACATTAARACSTAGCGR